MAVLSNLPASRASSVVGLRQRQSIRATLLLSVAISGVAFGVAHAQSASNSTSAQAASSMSSPSASSAVNAPALNDVIITGTRQSGQRARNSATPITIITGDQLRATGQIDLRSALQQLSPNIALQTIGSQGAGFKDTVQLDGLSPDNVLVLVNGKRRHSTANITQVGGWEPGSTGVDLDLIPISAIDHIEILQAGDSAQYGSDAIAGVINIILKSADHGGSVDTTEGQYYAGDGFSRDLAGNVGTGLGQNGFLNLSAEYSGHDHTNRTFLDPGDEKYDMRGGNENSTDREELAVNSGYYFNENLEAYGFATYAHRTGGEFQNSRTPLVLPELYPNGFTPQETITENDFSITAGVKGKNLAGWAWDLSTTYGADYDDVNMFESANIGLYNETGYTPTTFHLYDLTSTQLTNNLDLTRPVSVPYLPFPVNVSVGAEDRREGYDIGGGDAASIAYSGSQASPGLSPASTGSWTRNVVGTYIDLATKFTSKWQFDTAGRFEHYSDVGNTSNGKISTRYDFSPQIAVRASFGTGFDAPSLAQEQLTSFTASPANGLLAADSAAARSIGATPLKPEHSTNYNLGLVLNPLPNLNITADAYQIDVRDRIVEGGTVSGEGALAALSEAGFTVAPTLTPSEVSAGYFTNGASTRTRGIDIAGNYLTDFQDHGIIRWDLAANINDTEILSIAKGSNGKSILNAQQIADLTTVSPKFKVIVGGNWNLRKWGVTAHENFFGPTTDELTYFYGPDAYSTTKFQRFHQGIEYTTDAAVHYLITPALQLSVGAINLFNYYPKTVPYDNALVGQNWDETSVSVNNYGGFYYVNLKLRFG